MQARVRELQNLQNKKKSKKIFLMKQNKYPKNIYMIDWTFTNYKHFFTVTVQRGNTAPFWTQQEKDSQLRFYLPMYVFVSSFKCCLKDRKEKKNILLMYY